MEIILDQTRGCIWFVTCRGKHMLCDAIRMGQRCATTRELDGYGGREGGLPGRGKAPPQSCHLRSPALPRRGNASAPVLDAHRKTPQ